jgi:hypothetical protein
MEHTIAGPRLTSVTGTNLLVYLIMLQSKIVIGLLWSHPGQKCLILRLNTRPVTKNVVLSLDVVPGDARLICAK